MICFGLRGRIPNFRASCCEAFVFMDPCEISLGFTLLFALIENIFYIRLVFDSLMVDFSSMPELEAASRGVL